MGIRPGGVGAGSTPSRRRGRPGASELRRSHYAVGASATGRPGWRPCPDGALAHAKGQRRGRGPSGEVGLPVSDQHAAHALHDPHGLHDPGDLGRPQKSTAETLACRYRELNDVLDRAVPGEDHGGAGGNHVEPDLIVNLRPLVISRKAASVGLVLACQPDAQAEAGGRTMFRASNALPGQEMDPCRGLTWEDAPRRVRGDSRRRGQRAKSIDLSSAFRRRPCGGRHCPAARHCAVPRHTWAT